MKYISGQALKGTYKGQEISGKVESYKESQILLMADGKWIPLEKLESHTIVGNNLREDLKKSIEDNVQMDWKGVGDLVKDNKKTPDEVVSFYQDKVKQNVKDAQSHEKDADEISREIVLDNLAKANNDGTKGNDDLELEKCVTELETDLVEKANILKKHLDEYNKSFPDTKHIKEEESLDEDSIKDVTFVDGASAKSSTNIQDLLNNPESEEPIDTDEDLLNGVIDDFDVFSDTNADMESDTVPEDINGLDDDFNDDLVEDGFDSINLDLSDDDITASPDDIENTITSAIDSYDTSNGFSDEGLFNHVIDTLELGVDFGKSLFETHDRNASDSLVALSEALNMKASLNKIGDKIAAFFLKLIGYKNGLDTNKLELVGSVKMATSSKIENDDFRDSSKQKQIVNAIHTVLGNSVDSKTADKIVDDIFYKIIPNHATNVLQTSGRNGGVSEENAKKFYDFNNCENYIQSIKKQVAA